MSGKQQGLLVTLAACVLGLYASFLLWLVLQERINTKPYGLDARGQALYFKAPLVVNIVQSFFAAVVGLVYSLASSGKNPFGIFTRNDKPTVRAMARLFTLIAITSSVGSPLGYALLKHVDYIGFLLAKLCKLIPVMLVHTLLYRTRFLPYKYVVATVVSAGVVVFTLAQAGANKGGANDGQTLLGMSMLVGLMVLDGLTNLTQDQLFKLLALSQPGPGQKLTGASLMCVLNLIVFVLTAAYAYVFTFELNIAYALHFAQAHPAVITNVLLFAVLGSVGQVFIFIILEKFDSLVLVTATVTRKMMSMILSVVLFGHRLNPAQWLGVGMVFGGIGYEAYVKAQPRPAADAKAKKA